MPIVEEKLDRAIYQKLEEAFAVSKWLTDHPEVSGEEKEGSAHIIRFLEEHGYEVEGPFGIPYSFKAKYKGDHRTDVPKVALLCEFDALPELGHACGHSLSCGISLLTAMALREAYPDLPMQLDIVGTPAEETTGGKILMAENHAFDEYDLAIMSHLDWENAPHAALLASNDMQITFYGKAAHASGNPEDGINAFNAAQLFVHASDMLRQHLPKDCQYHGIITNGGAAPNIVPDKVTLEYYLRAETTKHLTMLREKLEACVKGAAIATGCTYEVGQKWGTYSSIFYPTDTLQEVIRIYDELGMSYQLYDQPSGSSDVGNVDQVVPCLCMYCKCSDTYVTLHTPEVVPLLYGERGRKTMHDGTLVMAAFLALLANHPEKMAHLKEEHDAYWKKA